MNITDRDTSSVPAKTVEFTDVIDSASPPPGPAGPFVGENRPLACFPGPPHPLKGKALGGAYPSNPWHAGPFVGEIGPLDRFPGPPHPLKEKASGGACPSNPGPAGPFGTENDPLVHFPGVPHPLEGKALISVSLEPHCERRAKPGADDCSC